MATQRDFNYADQMTTPTSAFRKACILISLDLGKSINTKS